LALLLLRAVTATGLLAVADTLSVERTTDDLVANTRQVLHTTATHEHDGVLLQVVAHTGDVGRDLDAVGEPHTGHLAQCRVGLLGSRGVDALAHTPPLRTPLEGRRLGRRHLVLPALADQLLNSGHCHSVSCLAGVTSVVTIRRHCRCHDLRIVPRLHAPAL